MGPLPVHTSGTVVAGRYRLVQELGRGAMGVVWLAEHLTLHAPVAVKLVDSELLDAHAEDRAEVLARFDREAQAAAVMRSPHVVQILDHGFDGGVPFIVMEHLEGETLEERLLRYPALPPEMTEWVVTHIARAVSKAHDAGIVHRDLKPGNVFLVRNDEEEIAKVLDFGIAKFTHLTAQAGVLRTKAGDLIGTPAYMSPEQASGAERIDHRSDVWALGVIAFQCVTGRLPFDSNRVGDLILQICARPLPIPSHIASVPPGFDEWFAKACAREPADRFQGAKEAADALRPLLGVPTSPHRSALITAPILSDARSSRSADMTHRGVVSALHATKRGPSIWRITVVSAVLTVAVLGAGAFALLRGADSVGVSGDRGVEAVAPPGVEAVAPTLAAEPTVEVGNPATELAQPIASDAAGSPPKDAATAEPSASASASAAPPVVTRPPPRATAGSGTKRTPPPKSPPPQKSEKDPNKRLGF